MNINIRSCSINDLDQLQSIGHETYDETFRTMNSQEKIDKYPQKSFNKEKLFAELKNSDCQFYFLYVENELAGYLKLNTARTQSDVNGNELIENR